MSTVARPRVVCASEDRHELIVRCAALGHDADRRSMRTVRLVHRGEHDQRVRAELGDRIDALEIAGEIADVMRVDREAEERLWEFGDARRQRRSGDSSAVIGQHLRRIRRGRTDVVLRERARRSRRAAARGARWRAVRACSEDQDQTEQHENGLTSGQDDQGRRRIVRASSQRIVTRAGGSVSDESAPS